jgi:hypothetical protein
MSILVYNFKELTKSIEEVEQIEAKVNNSKKKRRGWYALATRIAL